MTSLRRTALLLVLVTLAGWALRLPLLGAFPLREDEAIYAVWARAAWTDPWFLSTWPDKPPLFLWIQALLLPLVGPTAAGARVASILASTLTIPVTAAAARRLWPHKADQAALASGALMALSPFAISFAATGYTDSLLVLWGMLALALAVRGQFLGAGLALGAAIMTKQQGLLYAPLIAAVPLLLPAPRRPGRQWAALAAGLALMALPILLWDAARWATAPSPWDLGARNYGTLGLAPLSEVPERARAWAVQLWYLAASPWVWGVLLLTLAAGSLAGRGRRSPLAAAAAAWGLAVVALHVVSTLQPWDRYLLPLAPLVALLAGGAAAQIELPRGWQRFALALVALLALAPPAVTAARGGYPVGADHGDQAGLDEALAYVDAQGGSTILYHRLVGWQARYTLYDAIGQGRVELRWFPHAVYLADNAVKAPHRKRFVFAPDLAPTGLARALLLSRGLALTERMRSGAMIVYAIEPAAAPADCLWCLCRAPAWTITPPAPQSPVP